MSGERLFEKLKELKREFINSTKKVLKEKVSTNPNTLRAYVIEITENYNNLVEYIENVYTVFGEKEKQVLNEQFTYVRGKLAESYLKLQCNYVISDKFCAKIQIEQESELDESLNYESFILEIKEESEVLKVDLKTDEKLVSVQDSNSNSNLHLIPENSINNKMVDLTKLELLKLCAGTINQNYEGDPLKLESFINAIKLLETMATTTELQSTLVSFIKTKLVGKALEYMPTGTLTTDQIITVLREKIRPESSKIIEGRLAALRSDRQSLQNFSKMAEELAENLKRSLIMEGMTVEKANEVTIDRTVKMCRSSAKNDLTRAVIASTKFSEPKEVISTFIVEIGQEVEERQILAYRSQKKRNNNNNNRNQYQNQNRNRGNNYNRNNNNNYNNNHKNHGYRGKKRYNNNDNNNNNYNNRQSNDNDRNGSNGNSRNVRYTSSGNERRPVQEQRELVNREEL